MGNDSIKTNDGFQPNEKIFEGYQPYLQHGYQPVEGESRGYQPQDNVNTTYPPNPPKSGSNVLPSENKN